MQPNTEEIIRITAELQGHIRQGMVDLIQSGAKLGSLHPVLECFNALDRVVQDMAEPHREMGAAVEVSPDGFYYWRDRAMKAEAELMEMREIARIRAEAAQIRAEESHA